jgi:hypothetical protein
MATFIEYEKNRHKSWRQKYIKLKIRQKFWRPKKSKLNKLPKILGIIIYSVKSSPKILVTKNLPN